MMTPEDTPARCAASEKLYTSYQAALLIGCSQHTARNRAKRLGLGRRDEATNWSWLYTADEIEQMADISDRQYRRRNLPRCPRCTIFTDGGGLCDECEYEVAHGRYPVADELTGEIG